MRPVDQANPRTLFPSSSAVTYWQIEMQEGGVAGMIEDLMYQTKLCTSTQRSPMLSKFPKYLNRFQVKTIASSSYNTETVKIDPGIYYWHQSIK